jgi:hypothetical protein
MDERFGITPLGRQALGVSRLERSWPAVPPDVQERILRALDQVSADYSATTVVIPRPRMGLVACLTA